MSPLTVVATIVAKPGKEAETEAVLLALIAPSRQDAGCIQYDLHSDLENPRAFLFTEIWESRAALDRHLETPHLTAFKARIPELVETLEIRLLETISSP